MTTEMWAVWALVLLAQNFSFTFVSRARNSGSLKRHMIASMLSNGVWFCSQILAVKTFMDILSGKFGLGESIFACAFYTTFTLLGSLVAHHWALKTEKGHSAVGANKKFAQITKEEWEAVVRHLRTITYEKALEEGK